jgi:hypothetical protein
MFIDIVPNRNSPPAILLREGYREGGKVKKRTLANLSKPYLLPPSPLTYSSPKKLSGSTLWPGKTRSIRSAPRCRAATSAKTSRKSLVRARSRPS